MKKYRYIVYTIPWNLSGAELEDLLNQDGKEGWQLVQLTQIEPLNATPRKIAIFEKEEGC